MKKEVDIEGWIKYLVQRDNDVKKQLEHLSAEVEEINKKLHLIGRSVLKLYKEN